MSSQERTDDTIKLEEIIERAKGLTNEYNEYYNKDPNVPLIPSKAKDMCEFVEEIARLRA